MSAGFITSPKIYKDWAIFQLFQTWKKYGNEFWKSRGVNLYPTLSPFPSHSLLAEREAHVRGWEQIACRRH